MISKSALIDIGIFKNNIYLDKYIDLLNTKGLESKIKYETQLHHIIPRSYYKKFNLEVDNSNENTIFLRHKDHAEAHVYLSLCLSDPYLAGASKSCVKYILNNYHKLDNTEYLSSEEFFKELDCYDDILKIKYTNIKISKDTRLKMSKSHKGKPSKLKGIPLSKEHKEKISKNSWSHLHKGEDILKLSDATKEKISESVKKYQLDFKVNHEEEYIARCNKISNSTKGIKKSEEFCKHLSESRKGEGNPFYGLKHTDEWKENHSKKMSGEGNPMFGKPLSEESLRRMVEKRRANGTYGPRKYVNNGVENKLVKVDEIDSYLSNGWVLGKLK